MLARLPTRMMQAMPCWVARAAAVRTPRWSSPSDRAAMRPVSGDAPAVVRFEMLSLIHLLKCRGRVIPPITEKYRGTMHQGRMLTFQPASPLCGRGEAGRNGAAGAA